MPKVNLLVLKKVQPVPELKQSIQPIATHITELTTFRTSQKVQLFGKQRDGISVHQIEQLYEKIESFS